MPDAIETIREVLRELGDVLLSLHMQNRDREPAARVLDRCSEELTEVAQELRAQCDD